ncbi:hypothetical protein P0082_05160 [Candidatus Haliotispira prima]|uniref:HTH araC/xylS-type domain-containing protein n=1 Tax=Candidatus Haliotispira prima TaxID=3034016 RepID=A0ABY8MJV3_9SPIO|nr:hypothetical protein P0082_05160 [Candidatus Haliotispira prima]
MSARHQNHVPKSPVLKLIYYAGKLFQRMGYFTFREFRQFFSVPKDTLANKDFGLTARYNINSMGLWCAVGIAIIHLIYYVAVISDPGNLPNFDIRVEGNGPMAALQNFNYSLAERLQKNGFHLVNTSLFTLFLITWLYIHYAYGRFSKRISLLCCIIYVIGNNLISMTSLSLSFTNVWLIMAPIIIIPAVGNRRSLPLLLANFLLHHLLVSYGQDSYDILISIASSFVAIFIMMMQMEYYRREARLQESTGGLNERALEIELIKENIDSGLMLLDPDLKVRPNFSDMCIKLLHKKDLRDKYFPQLLRDIVEGNQYFINSVNHGVDPEGDDYVINDVNEWEERIKHYFEMLATEHLNNDELASIDPLKYIKIYSYEGRSYISFHVSTIKVKDQIQYYMVLISNDTGKVAGRYRILEHERKHLEKARLLFALSHDNPIKQLDMLNSFAQSYLKLCKNVLTEVRNTLPPQQLIDTVTTEFRSMQQTLGDLNLERYVNLADELLQKCDNFNRTEPEHSDNVTITNKATQTQYIQLIVDCERFLHEVRPLFSLSTFFVRESGLTEELQKQKQLVYHSLNQDILQSDEITDFYNTQLNQESQILINLYTAFEMLLNQNDLQSELELVEEKFKQEPPKQEPRSGTSTKQSS